MPTSAFFSVAEFPAVINAPRLVFDGTGGKVTPSNPSLDGEPAGGTRNGWTWKHEFAAASAGGDYAITAVTYTVNGIAGENTFGGGNSGTTPLTETNPIASNGGSLSNGERSIALRYPNTTYNNQGWHVSAQGIAGGLKAWMSTLPLAGTAMTEIRFTVYNPTSSTISNVGFALDTDVMIKGDDRATVYGIPGNYGFYMSGNDMTLALVNANNGYKGASAYNWWGYWTPRTPFTTQNTNAPLYNTDSGAVANVQSISVQAGEVYTFSFYIGTGTYEQIMGAIDNAIRQTTTPPVTISVSNPNVVLTDANGDPLGDLNSETIPFSFVVSPGAGYVLDGSPSVGGAGVTAGVTPNGDGTYTVNVTSGNLENVEVNAPTTQIPASPTVTYSGGYANIETIDDANIYSEDVHLFIKDGAGYVDLGVVSDDDIENGIDWDTLASMVGTYNGLNSPGVNISSGKATIHFQSKITLVNPAATGWGIPTADVEVVQISTESAVDATVYVQTDGGPPAVWEPAPANGMYPTTVYTSGGEPTIPGANGSQDNVTTFAIRPDEGYTLNVTGGDPDGAGGPLSAYTPDSNPYNGGTFTYPGGNAAAVTGSPFNPDITGGTLENLAETGNTAIETAITNGGWNLTAPVDPAARGAAIDAVSDALKAFIGTGDADGNETYNDPDETRQKFTAAFPDCDVSVYNSLTDKDMVLDQLAREIVDNIIAGTPGADPIRDTFGDPDGDPGDDTYDSGDALFNDYTAAQKMLENSAADPTTPVTVDNGTKPRATVNADADGDITIGVIELFPAGGDADGFGGLNETKVYIGAPVPGNEINNPATPLSAAQIAALEAAGYITVVTTDERGYEVETRTAVTMNEVSIEGTPSNRGLETETGGTLGISIGDTTQVTLDGSTGALTTFTNISTGAVSYLESTGTYAAGTQPQTQEVVLTADPLEGAYVTGFEYWDEGTSAWTAFGSGTTPLGTPTTSFTAVVKTGANITQNSTLTYTPAGAIPNIRVKYRNLLDEINNSASNGKDAMEAMNDTNFEDVFNISPTALQLIPAPPGSATSGTQPNKDAYDTYTGLNGKMAIGNALEKSMGFTDATDNDATAAEIKDAFEALVVLQYLIEAAEEVMKNAGSYTAGTLDETKAALDAAKAVRDRGDATVSVSDLNTASDDLKTKLNNIVYKLFALQIQSNLTDTSTEKQTASNTAAAISFTSISESDITDASLTTSYFHYPIAATTVTVTITPVTGYVYTAKLDDTVIQPVNNVITLNNFDKSHLLQIIFEKIERNIQIPNIAAADIKQGALDVSGQTLTTGFAQPQTFSIAPINGYMLKPGAEITYEMFDDSGASQGSGTADVGLDGTFTISGTATQYEVRISQSSLMDAIAPITAEMLGDLLEAIANDYGGTENLYTPATWAALFADGANPALDGAFTRAEDALYGSSAPTDGELQALYNSVVGALSALHPQYSATMPSTSYELETHSGIVEKLNNGIPYSPKQYYVAKGTNAVLKYVDLPDGKSLGSVAYDMGGVPYTVQGSGDEAVLYGVSGEIANITPVRVDAGFGVAADPNPDVTTDISGGDTYTITPNDGYDVTSVTIDGVEVTFEDGKIKSVAIGEESIEYSNDVTDYSGTAFDVDWDGGGTSAKVTPTGGDEFTVTLDPVTGEVTIVWTEDNTGGHTVTSETALIGATATDGITVNGILPGGTPEAEGTVTPGSEIQVNLPTEAGKTYNPAAVIEYTNNSVVDSIPVSELQANGGIIPDVTANGAFAITGVTDGTNQIPLMIPDEHAQVIGKILEWEALYADAEAIANGPDTLTDLEQFVADNAGRAKNGSLATALLEAIFKEADDDAEPGGDFLAALNVYLDEICSDGLDPLHSDDGTNHDHATIAGAIAEIEAILGGLINALENEMDIFDTIGDAVLPYGFEEELDGVTGFVNGPVDVEVDVTGGTGNETLDVSGITTSAGYELETVTVNFNDGSKLVVGFDPDDSEWLESPSGTWTNTDGVVITAVQDTDGTIDYGVSIPAGMFGDGSGTPKTITGIEFRAARTGFGLPGADASSIAIDILGKSDLGAAGAGLTVEIQDSTNNEILTPNSVVPNDGYIVLQPTYGDDDYSTGGTWKHEFASVTIGGKTFYGTEGNSPVSVDPSTGIITIDVEKAIEAGVEDFTSIVVNTLPTNPQYKTFIQEVSEVKDGVDRGTLSLADAIKEIERLLAQTGNTVPVEYQLTDDNKAHLKDDLEQLKVWKASLESAAAGELEGLAIGNLYDTVDNALIAAGSSVDTANEKPVLSGSEIAAVMNNKAAIDKAKLDYDALPQSVKDNIDPQYKAQLNELTGLLEKAQAQILTPEDNFRRLVNELKEQVLTGEYNETMETLIEKAQEAYGKLDNSGLGKQTGNVIPEKNQLDSLISQVDGLAGTAADEYIADTDGAGGGNKSFNDLISSGTADDISDAKAEYDRLPQAVRGKVNEKTLDSHGITVPLLYAETFPGVAGLLSKAQILERLDKASPNGDYITTTDLLGDSQAARDFASLVVTAKESYDNLTQADKNSLDETLTLAGGQDYPTLYAAAQIIVDTNANTFIDDYLKPAGGGGIYTTATQGNYARILGGWQAAWDALTKAEQDAVNMALKEAGSASSYPQIVAAAETQRAIAENANINDVRNAAVRELDTAFSMLNSGDYEAGDWATIQSIYNTARSNILSPIATATIGAINAAKTTAIDAMKAVPKKAGGTGGGSSDPGGSGSSSVGKTNNGTITLNPSSPNSGEIVVVSVEPDSGYTLDKLTITNDDGKAIPYIDNGDGTFSYIQPNGNVSVDASFKPAGSADGDVSELLITDEHIAYIQGNNGEFRPNASMSRAEVAQMFYNLLRDKNVDITESFPDIASGAWYAEAVNTLASLGILTGYTDGEFHPNDDITRAQFAAIAVRFAELSQGSIHFDDVPSDHWAYRYINTAAYYGWVNGVGNDLFAPERDITRAEAVTLVNRMLDRKGDKTFIDANIGTLVSFSDVDKSHWAYYNIIDAANTYEYN